VPKSMPPLVIAYDGVAILWVSLFTKPAESRWLFVAHVAVPAAASTPSAISPSTHPMTKDTTRPAVHPRRLVGGPGGDAGADGGGGAGAVGSGSGADCGGGGVSAKATIGPIGPVGRSEIAIPLASSDLARRNHRLRSDSSLASTRTGYVATDMNPTPSIFLDQAPQHIRSAEGANLSEATARWMAGGVAGVRSG
jgi:hypothetical protein